jgi:hypothetical protein
MSEQFNENEIWRISYKLRRRYHSLRDEACDIQKRSESLSQIRELFIFDIDYDFDPAQFLTDAKIPKGQILQKLREACKDEKSHSP